MAFRGVLSLALFAALCGAPSFVSAAGNDLTAPAASPETGSTSTVFSFSVRYEGKFAATSVTAAVAGLVLPMSLAGGTAETGTWVTATELPAGIWPVTFTASAERGNAGTVTGPTVTVSGPISTEPPPAPLATPGQPGGGKQKDASSTPDGGAEGGSTSAPAPAEPASSPPAEPSAPEPPAAPAADAVLPPGPSGGEGVGGPAAPAAPDEPVNATTIGGPSSTDGSVTTPVSTPREADGSDGSPVGDGLLQSVLVMGLAGVAAVALIGTTLLLVGKRRGRRDEEPLPAFATPERASRSRRQAVLTRMGEDPIMAALGISSDESPRQRARAGQVGSGPDEPGNRTRRH